MYIKHARIKFPGALRERFPNKFLKNDIFDQLNNGKQSCNLIWYAVTGGVLIVTAVVLISVTVTVWNTQNQSMEAEEETEELCGLKIEIMNIYEY